MCCEVGYLPLCASYAYNVGMPRPKRRPLRHTMRFDKVIPVYLSNDEYCEFAAVCRNLSAAGMVIETPQYLPLGSEVRVHFQMPDSQGAVTARVEVKNHYAFNYSHAGEQRSARGMGVRFVAFEDDTTAKMGSARAPSRTLH